jgi:hypothetical protein
MRSVPLGKRDSSLLARFVFFCSFSCTGVRAALVAVDDVVVVVEVVVLLFAFAGAVDLGAFAAPLPCTFGEGDDFGPDT